MTAKTPAEKVRAMRERRAKLGLVRLELYAHPEDHAAIKEYAARKNVARLRKEKDK